ncbi:MAG: sarcosine oxidase subunit alpha family protein [Pseudomonadales bacterium]|nr:sarcosine oxidase subunit alpha family protein [Pseudomonadales bacterium]
MSQVNRLAEGGRIDRNAPVRFQFDGQTLTGYSGDTLASALLANGIDIVGRSFKFSRPRGIMAAGMEEPNALMQIGSGTETVPNVLATQAEIYHGLIANPTNGWPSAKFDVTALAGMFAPLLPPGFYNKTFMWPGKAWLFYEWFIRRMAGFGKAPTGADPDIYDKLNHHCDVLVVGAGPAGLHAASVAADSGARVILLDEQSEYGGSLLSTRQQIDAAPAMDWVQKTVARLVEMDNVTLLSRTTAFGYYDHNFVAALERRTDHLSLVANAGSRQRLHRIRAGQVILATGAIERLPVFSNNDRPGVMLASAVSSYINRYAVVPGNTMVLFACSDSAWQTALDHLHAGRRVAAVIDPRPAGTGMDEGSEVFQTLRNAGTEILQGHAVVDVAGRRRVAGVFVAPVADNLRSLTGKARRIACDLLAVSSGWSPAIHLSCHTGTRPVWSEEQAAFLPGNRKGCFTAGSVNGKHDLAACLQDANQVANQALKAAGFSASNAQLPVVEQVNSAQSSHLFLVPHQSSPTRAPKQFVDFQNDVTAGAIHIAAIEGYESVEHVKRYTAMGFGTDQGKLGNINGVAILADALGKPIAETGTTMFRPAYTPVTFGAVAGRDVASLFDPERLTAIHQWHEEHQAAWENVGQWKRPWYYPRPGENMQQAVNRECRAVRNGVGILDASTLGKIDIQGPDAGEFLDRIYTNRFSNLAVGKCRYGLMLKEDGMVFDDGVVARLAQNRYLATTTTGGAAAVLQWMELWLQTEWPELDVWLTSVTDHWATIAIAGPDSRKVMTKVCADVSFDTDDFKFMDWREGVVAGVPARIMRVSFTGELSYEINVPADYGRYVWEACIAAGEEFDITPYGTETMHVLRAEKGFVIVGQDTDGSVTPHDLGMSWIVNNKKPFSFIGKRSLSRSDTSSDTRKHWVGLLPINKDEKLPEGGQLVDDPLQKAPATMLGHVTSSYYSVALGRTFALGYVRNGRERMGDIVQCPFADSRIIPAKIVTNVFLDEAGERQNV